MWSKGWLLAAIFVAGVPMLETGEGERLNVVASIAPLADFARQVGGDRAEVIMLVPPGASPHTYELKPSQVQQVARARLLVLNGVGLEYWADKLVRAAHSPHLRVVDTSRGVPLLEGDPHEGHAHAQGNPHIWLDPRQAMVQVGHIRDALVRVDPPNAPAYQANAARFLGELQALDQQIAGEIATWRHREFIAFHPAWAYFARRYGLVQAAVIERSPGREPSPAELARIVETARRIGARAIFAEPQFSPKAAETIARESGARVLFLDPLGARLQDGGYLALMRSNLAQMAQALR